MLSIGNHEEIVLPTRFLSPKITYNGGSRWRERFQHFELSERKAFPFF